MTQGIPKVYLFDSIVDGPGAFRLTQLHCSLPYIGHNNMGEQPSTLAAQQLTTGQQLHQAGKLIEAINAYQAAYKLDPGLAEAQHARDWRCCNWASTPWASG